MPDLLVVKGSDFSKIQLSVEEILRIVEESIAGIGNGNSVNPPKISIEPVPKSMTIAMLAQVKSTAALGIKAYTEFPLPDGRSVTSSTLTLFNDLSGELLAFMDCQWITAARTGAVTALFAREAATPDSKVALIVGAGAMAKETVPALLKVMPEIEEVIIRAPRRDAVEAFIAGQAEALQGRKATISETISDDAARADIVIGAAGPGAHGLVSYDMLKPGTTAILLGYGIDPDVLHKADRVIATSESQMHVTGKDLAHVGSFPKVDAELSDILLKRKPARTSPQEIIFAYNSGLAVTDVAVAAALYKVARENGIGHLISGF
jgi:ornithine cyclodeaminase